MEMLDPVCDQDSAPGSAVASCAGHMDKSLCRWAWDVCLQDETRGGGNEMESRERQPDIWMSLDTQCIVILTVLPSLHITWWAAIK